MKISMPEIIGNDALRQRICRDILANSLSHAYIIEGPDGSGRHTIALNAAAALACESKDDESVPLPCGVCPSCRKILAHKSPDVIFIGSEGKASLGVDTARFIKEDVYTLPNDLEDKIYIVEDSDKMTVQAQNAILLTLEEPPKFVHFFLLCNNASTLLETIRSRAPILRTEPVPSECIDDYLCKNDRRAAQMKLSSPSEYAELLISAKGGIGKALEFLEPKVWKPLRERRVLVLAFIDAATAQKSAAELLSLISAFSNKRDQLEKELSELLDALRDLILLRKSDNAPLSFFADREYATEICDRCSTAYLHTLYTSVSEAIAENKRNANVRLMLMKMAITSQLI